MKNSDASKSKKGPKKITKTENANAETAHTRWRMAKGGCQCGGKWNILQEDARRHRGINNSKHTTKPKKEEMIGLLIQIDMGYAEDTNMLLGRDTHGQLCARVGNYDISS